jgi:hypothetical protein
MSELRFHKREIAEKSTHARYYSFLLFGLDGIFTAFLGASCQGEGEFKNITVARQKHLIKKTSKTHRFGFGFFRFGFGFFRFARAASPPTT